MAYAENTSVPVERSRAEIERILARYGAAQFAYMTNEKQAMICFVVRNMLVKFLLPLPDRNEKQFTNKRARGGSYFYAEKLPPEKQYALYEQACRTKWRALALAIKAKLESVASGITTFEQEFLAHFVIQGGQTFGEYAIPKLQEAHAKGLAPQLTLLS